MDKARPRFRLLIYPRFQLSLIFANFAMLALTLIFVGVQLQRAFSELKRMGASAHIPNGHAYFKFLDWEASHLYSYLSTALVISFVVQGLLTLSISHRLAGPIVRLRNYFKRIVREGTPNDRIKFRKKDFFSDLPEIINKAIKRMSQERSSKGTKKAA